MTVDQDRLADRYEIEKLKSRYFRAVDTRLWDGLRDLLTDDMTFYVGDAPTFTSADALVAYFAGSDPARVTVHQGHTPEIDFTGPDRDTGIWALADRVEDPAGTVLQGFGHYHDVYIRGADGRWRIHESRLTRLRVDHIPAGGDGPGSA